MFKGFLDVIKREIKFILGNRRMMVILCGVPLLFTIIFGSIYSEKTISGLRLAVLDNSKTQVSRSLVQSFGKTDTFILAGNLEHESQIPTLLEEGEIDAVLVIPDGFTQDVKLGKSATVLIGANGGNMSISNTALTKAAEITGAFSAGITIKRFEAEGFIDEEAYNKTVPIGFEIRRWFNPTNNYSNFLLLGYVAAILQQVVMYFAAITITEEKRKGTIAELQGNSHGAGAVVLGKIMSYVLVGLVVWFFSLLTVFFLFSTPMRGNWLILILLSFVFLLCISAIAFFISTTARRSLDATQYAMIVALPSFLLCGYTWPLVAMTKLFRIIAHIFPITYFATNVRNIALMDAGIGMVMPDMMILLTISLIFIALSIVSWQVQFEEKKSEKFTAIKKLLST